MVGEKRQQTEFVCERKEGTVSNWFVRGRYLCKWKLAWKFKKKKNFFTRGKHPCPQQDSNLWSQKSCCFRLHHRPHRHQNQKMHIKLCILCKWKPIKQLHSHRLVYLKLDCETTFYISFSSLFSNSTILKPWNLHYWQHF